MCLSNSTWNSRMSQCVCYLTVLVFCSLSFYFIAYGDVLICPAFWLIFSLLLSDPSPPYWCVGGEYIWRNDLTENVCVHVCNPLVLSGKSSNAWILFLRSIILLPVLACWRIWNRPAMLRNVCVCLPLIEETAQGASIKFQVPGSNTSYVLHIP